MTGFGPFPGVEFNPSGEVARALAEAPPPGVEVRAAVLPVAFARVPAAWDDLLAGDGVPALLLSLGVHPGSSFRLERTARALLSGGRTDADGDEAPAGSLGGGDRSTLLPLEELARALAAAGAPEVELSGDAGGYVCERAYHHLLGCADQRGIPGLFLHVPPAEVLGLDRQVPVVRALLAAAMAASLRAPST